MASVLPKVDMLESQTRRSRGGINYESNQNASTGSPSASASGPWQRVFRVLQRSPRPGNDNANTVPSGHQRDEEFPVPRREQFLSHDVHGECWPRQSTDVSSAGRRHSRAHVEASYLTSYDQPTENQHGFDDLIPSPLVQPPLGLAPTPPVDLVAPSHRPGHSHLHANHRRSTLDDRRAPPLYPDTEPTDPHSGPICAAARHPTRNHTYPQPLPSPHILPRNTTLRGAGPAIRATVSMPVDGARRSRLLPAHAVDRAENRQVDAGAYPQMATRAESHNVPAQDGQAHDEHWLRTPCASPKPFDTDEEGKRDTARTIREIVHQILTNIPLRLLNTEDGKLYLQEDLVTAFEKSEQYSALMLLTTPQMASQYRGYLEDTVRNYFVYAMLSHRWEQGEPLLENINSSVFKMVLTPGIAKLQGFLITAQKMGYQWAWSDTCCIDKKSSVELQESIPSMFSWYRNSAMTIVYLSDVPDSSPDALMKSEWFKRIWTLQEMLAPRALRLFKNDWTPYINGRHINDKCHEPTLELLERATRIDKGSIRDFTPGIMHARERLRWAQQRKSIKEADIGYGLMGIFGIRLTIDYGEKGAAFGRLLAEIVRCSGDVTLLDWTGDCSSFNSGLPAHPSCYYEEGTGTLGTLPTNLTDRDRYAYGWPALPQVLIPPFPQQASSAQAILTAQCIAHQVQTLKFHYEPARTHRQSRYDIFAEGLEPLHVTTLEHLEERTPSTCTPEYTLVRVTGISTFIGDAHRWKNKSANGPPSAVQAGEPFLVLLLMSRGNGFYRRIPTTYPIFATVTGAGGGNDPNVDPFEIL